MEVQQKPKIEFSVFLGKVRVHISEIKVQNEVTWSKDTGIELHSTLLVTLLGDVTCNIMQQSCDKMATS